jgi:uncharacterized membrane protein
VRRRRLLEVTRLAGEEHVDEARRFVGNAWPFYLAYVVSFLTIGAAWLAHGAITDRLTKADLGLLRLNLLLLLFVAVLPFPTRLVAEGPDDVSGERVFVAIYGIVLLAIRVLLYALDTYARWEHLYARGSVGDV